MQRFIDEKRPDLHVTLTAAGGAPFDINTVYHDQVETNTTGYVCSLPLMVVAYKENYHLPFEYTDVFEPPLCDSIQAWILSKDYGTWDINALIGIDKPIDQVLTPAARDFSSPIGQQLGQMFQKNSLCGEGQTWQPSTTTKFLIFHTLKDTYMTWKVAQEMSDCLKDKGCTVETYIKDMGDHVNYAMYTFYFESLIRIQRLLTPRIPSTSSSSTFSLKM